MIVNKETREKLFHELDLLKNAGVSIEIRDERYSSSSEKKGFVKIVGSTVQLMILESDPIELTISNIVEAGELVDHALAIEEHERNHPNFFIAARKRFQSYHSCN